MYGDRAWFSQLFLHSFYYGDYLLIVTLDEIFQEAFTYFFLDWGLICEFLRCFSFVEKISSVVCAVFEVHCSAHAINQFFMIIT